MHPTVPAAQTLAVHTPALDAGLPVPDVPHAQAAADRALAQLSSQQALFAEYAAHLDSPRMAWRKAGLPKLEPRSRRAEKVAALPKVRRAIEALRQLDSAQAARRHAETLNAAADAATMDPAVLLDEEGDYLPLDEIPVRWRRCIQGVSVTRRVRQRGRAIITETTTDYRFVDKPKMTDMVLKACGAYARDNAQQGLAVAAGIGELMAAMGADNAVVPGD